MSSGGGGFSPTIMSGIQDVAAILSLLGTGDVGSALTQGYFFAASAPMSIFGCLGLLSVGFKTFVACLSFKGIEGAILFGNMGFEPQGENLSLIMIDTTKGENSGRFVIENRIDALIDELNIDRNRIIGVSHKSATWNLELMATTALLCALSITPYIYINLTTDNLNLWNGMIWVFPMLRSTGGFIVATLTPLLIKRRIITLSDQYLARRRRDQLGDGDVEAAVDTKKYQDAAGTWLLLFLLLIGLLVSFMGYVGCFSIVQNSASTWGPTSWLFLETGLSVGRLVIWAWNPTRDDAPPLKIHLELDNYEPLPTCNKDNKEVLKHKVLPLTRARDFLKSITSFVGIIQPFSNPDLSLYYTLTWNRVSERSVLRRNRDNEPENAEKHELGEQTLYITVFDYKEHTTRVYTQDNHTDILYSTKSDAPLVDVAHFIHEVEIDAKIDPKGDPVCSDSNTLNSLRKHHRSILEHIQYRLRAGNVTKTYTIENSWTMKPRDTINTLHTRLQRLWVGNDNWKTAVEKGREERSQVSLPICDYFMHSSIERERRLLDEKRGKWIARRMEMIAKETKERLLGMGVEYRVDKKAVEKRAGTKSPEEVKVILGQERYFMELLLVYEVREWEQLFWNKFKAFLDEIENDRVEEEKETRRNFKAFLVRIEHYRVEEEKERLTKEWRANCWKRLNPQMHAAMERMADVDVIQYKETLSEQWALSIRLLFEGVENPDISLLSELRRWIRDKDEEMRLRIENEIEDTLFRLKRGLELGRFDQFWDDDVLFECRYSRSKWINFDQDSTVPLAVYSHALKGNKNLTHISFDHMDPDFDVNQFLCDLPLVTSISPDRFTTITAARRDLLFITSTNKDLNTFAKGIKSDPSSTYIFSDIRFSYSGKLGRDARVLITFVAPSSGKSLTLKVKHSGDEDAPLEVILGSTKIQLHPSSKSSLTIDDISLYPIEVSSSSESDRLSFVPEVRNDIYIGLDKFHRHFLHDIELLDEDGLEYMPHSASLSVLSK